MAHRIYDLFWQRKLQGLTSLPFPFVYFAGMYACHGPVYVVREIVSWDYGCILCSAPKRICKTKAEKALVNKTHKH